MIITPALSVRTLPITMAFAALWNLDFALEFYAREPQKPPVPGILSANL